MNATAVHQPSSAGTGRLAGKVALISGGAVGMGAAHARAFIREGACVVIGDILEAEGRSLARELGDKLKFVPLDVRDDAAWERAVALAEQEFGALHVLVNNAGVLTLGSVTDVDDQLWDTTFAINVSGVLKGMRSAAPAMERAGGGSMVNISSHNGMQGFEGVIAYGTSKWVVRGLTKCAALDFAPSNIRVNSVHPGSVMTRMAGSDPIDHRHKPFNRAAKPEEVSELVLLLASDESSFTTGSEFVIDGGEIVGFSKHWRKINNNYQAN